MNQERDLLGTPENVLRTPEERFEGLPDYPFTAHYVEVEPGLRMHYVEEGNRTDPVILLLHGEPAWSFLYRHIIPPLVKGGFRVIAPDLVGFGKSDKLLDKSRYTYHNHTAWLSTFIEQLSLDSIHLYAHDWGGMIGLRIVAAQPNLFSSVMVSYAFLFTGEEPIPDSFRQWQDFARTDATFLAGSVVDWATYSTLSPQVQQAYNAPFPEETYQVAARQFPLLIPTDPQDREAQINATAREKLKTFAKPFLTIWGDHPDAMWQEKDKILQTEIAGARDQPHQIVHAHHFLQEDQPGELTQIILRFIAKST